MVVAPHSTAALSTCARNSGSERLASIALNSTSAPAWVLARSRARLTMARVSASTHAGVFLIWYFICTGLVLMNVWMRGFSATLTASHAARALDLAGDGLDGLEIVRRSDGEAGLDDVDPQLGELAGDLELLGAVQRCARRLFAVAQRGVEDVDVAVLGHEVPTPPKAKVVATCGATDPVVIQEGAVKACRCLRIPPRGDA